MKCDQCGFIVNFEDEDCPECGHSVDKAGLIEMKKPHHKRRANFTFNLFPTSNMDMKNMFIHQLRRAGFTDEQIEKILEDW